MHYLDIIILIIVIASIAEGAIHGFVYEVFSLFGMLAGLFLAMKFCSEAANYLDFIPLSPWILKIIAFLLIMILINIVFRLVGKSLRLVLRKIFMGWIDRFAGAGFGLVRGVFVVLVITIVLLITPLSSIIKKEAPDTVLLKPSLELVRPLMKIVLEHEPPSFDSI